jgi:hypothetical protein
MVSRVLSGLLALAWWGALALGTGCGKEATGVQLTFLPGVPPAQGVVSVELALALGGQTATTTFARPDRSPLTLPTTAALQIGGGLAGSMVIEGTARNAAGAALASDRITVEVVAGQVVQASLTFGSRSDLDLGAGDLGAGDLGAGDLGAGDLASPDLRSVDQGAADLAQVGDLSSAGDLLAPTDQAASSDLSGGSPAMLMWTTQGGDSWTTTVGFSAMQEVVLLANRGTAPTGTVQIQLLGDTADFVVSDSCSGAALTGSCMFGVTFKPQSVGAKSLTVKATATPGGTDTLTFTGTGRGVGTITVTVSGAGLVKDSTGTLIACGNGQTLCSAQVTYTSLPAPNVRLIPTAGGGQSFAGWTLGPCEGTRTLACDVPMTSSATVSARFAAPFSMAFWEIVGLVDSTAALPVKTTANGVTASALTKSSSLQALTFNEAFMATGWPSASTPDLFKYFEFSVTAPSGGSAFFDTARFSLYNNTEGSSTWELRSSADGFAEALSTGTVPNGLFSAGTVVNAGLGGVGFRGGTVTFRLYLYGNTGTTNPQQRGLRGTNGNGVNLTVIGGTL